MSNAKLDTIIAEMRDEIAYMTRSGDSDVPADVMLAFIDRLATLRAPVNAPAGDGERDARIEALVKLADDVWKHHIAVEDCAPIIAAILTPPIASREAARGRCEIHGSYATSVCQACAEHGTIQPAAAPGANVSNKQEGESCA